MEIGDLVKAVENALDPLNADRIDLLSMYENSWKDSQVISEREKAESYLITEPFEVREGEAVKKEKTALLERPWFTRFITIAMFSDFWGYTLVEFQQQDEKGEFIDVKVFPRKHVRPYEKIIVATPSDRDGISYDGNETEFFLLELGDPENVGKLESITREIIWKTFARADWSEYNERYGKPLLDYELETDDEKEIAAAEMGAASFGSNCYNVHGPNAKLTIIPAASKASSDNYKDMATFCDEQIAKLMNGQTGTSTEKAYTGSSNVHERVQEKFTQARLKRIQDIVNYKLFPFLRHHGYPITDKTVFCFPSLDRGAKETPDKPIDPDKPAKPSDPAHPEGDYEKKKPSRMPAWVMSMPGT